MGKHIKTQKKHLGSVLIGQAIKAEVLKDSGAPAAPAAHHPAQQQQQQQQQQPHLQQQQAPSMFPRRVDLPSPAAAPPNPKMAAHLQTLSSTLLEPAYWQSVCSDLCCSNTAGSKAATSGAGSGDSIGGALVLPKQRLADLRQQIDDAGVAQVSAAELPWACSMQELALGVVQLLQHGWPPAFLLVFDEVWDIIQQMEAVMRHTTGNACNMDILAWYVDPNQGHRGFSPHRDRQPDDAPATFREDGSAMYTTAWIPFTDACPENSCLYVVPRYADPGYHEGDPEEEDAPDPLQRALHNKEAYQHIRALPAEAGSAVLFTHRIIHWGSQGRPGYHTPRISMSFGCADDAFEAPYFSRDHLPRPPLGLRLALAGAQMIIYHERFDMDARMLSLCHEAFSLHAQDFDAAYRRKVGSEFVAASKELVAKAAGGKAPANNGKAGRSASRRAQQDSGAAGGSAGAAIRGTSTAVTSAAGPSAGVGRNAAGSAGGKVANGGAAGSGAVLKPVGKRARIDPAAANGSAVRQRTQEQQPAQATQHSKQEQQRRHVQQQVDGDGSSDDDSNSSSDDPAGADSDGSGGSDALDRALDSMLDARMAGFDDFEDDFDNDFEDGGEGAGGQMRALGMAAAGFTGGSDDEEEEEEEEEGEEGVAAYDEHGLALGPSDIAAAKAAAAQARVTGRGAAPGGQAAEGRAEATNGAAAVNGRGAGGSRKGKGGRDGAKGSKAAAGGKRRRGLTAAKGAGSSGKGAQSGQAVKQKRVSGSIGRTKRKQ